MLLLGFLRFIGEAVFAFDLIVWGGLIIGFLLVIALLKFILTPHRK
jgi:hypothetical protein